MIKELTLKICGQEVKMRYCAAAEKAFEEMTNRSISIFLPTLGKDEEGKDIVVKPVEAQMGDYLTLALAAIIAAYAREGKEAPITSKDILYETTPEEVTLLIRSVISLRSEWYFVSGVVEEELEEKQGEQKNA